MSYPPSHGPTMPGQPGPGRPGPGNPGPGRPGPGPQQQPPPYPYRYPQQRPESGTIAWAVGLAVLAFFPFVSSVVASVLMIIVGLKQRAKEPIAAANGRNAANFGLTYLVVTLILVPLYFVMLDVLTKDGPTSETFPLMIPLIVWAVATLAFVVLCIIGVARAGARRVFRAPAIPVFRG